MERKRMGCDVHLWVEVWDNKLNEWQIADSRGSLPEYSAFLEEGFLSNRINKRKIFVTVDSYHLALSKWFDDIPDYLYYGRNYNLFYILAGVRNVSPSIQPISPPRGIPDDASEEYKMNVMDYGADGHSHSWFTIKELLVFDWEKYKFEHGLARFADVTIPAMRLLGPTSKVRIVFFFDN